MVPSAVATKPCTSRGVRNIPERNVPTGRHAISHHACQLTGSAVKKKQRAVCATAFLSPPGSQDIPEVVEVAEEVRGDKDLVKVLSPNYNILKFLHPVDECRLQRIRMAAALAAATYHMKSVTASKVRRKYGLELVTTSLVFSPAQAAHHIQEMLPPSDDVYYSMFDHGDGMAPHSDAIQASKTTASLGPTPSVQTAMAALKTHYPELLHERAQGQAAAEPASPHWNEPEAAATSRSYLEDSGWADASAAAPREWAWEESSNGILGGLTRTVSAVGSVAAKAAVAAAAVPPVAASINAVGGAWDSISRTAAAGPQGLGLSTISSVTAVASAGTKLQELSTVGWVSGNPAPLHVSPQGYTCSCHWFIADDPKTQVRSFVVQGTDCLESWKTNLNFEPTEFESPELNTKVHRGVYESAIVLYDVFLPLVEEHLRGDRFSRVAFAGHSLGGSLATVLALMFRHRGVITAVTQLDGVYTFGTAAVFCESSSAAPKPAKLSGINKKKSTPPPPTARDVTLVLDRLGLPRTSVMNVMTTKDIVPRAFACDYKLVANVLMSWSPSYASHLGLLASNRKLLYSFAGEQMLLQPAASFSWVSEEPEPRDLLFPPGPGLWLLGPPTTLSRLVAKMYTKQASDAARARAAGGKSDRPPPEEVPEAESVADALLHCMDKPHPFAILGDPRAYGPSGSISRYHNPDHYAMAVREVAVNSTARRAQLLADLVRFLAREQSQRSGVAWRRWLADWADSFAILQQATATAAEASGIMWAQLRRAFVAYQRNLLLRDSVAQSLAALASSVQAARLQTAATTSATTSAAAQGVRHAMEALKDRAESHFRPLPDAASGSDNNNTPGLPLGATPDVLAAGRGGAESAGLSSDHANHNSRMGETQQVSLVGPSGRVASQDVIAAPRSNGGFARTNNQAADVNLSTLRAEVASLRSAPELESRLEGSAEPSAWLPKVGRVLATLTLLPLSVAGTIQGPDHIAGALPGPSGDAEAAWSEAATGGSAASQWEADPQGPACDWPAR